MDYGTGAGIIEVLRSSWIDGSWFVGLCAPGVYLTLASPRIVAGATAAHTAALATADRLEAAGDRDAARDAVGVARSPHPARGG